MNFYDKVHDLVRYLRDTEEYKNYINLKEKIKTDSKLSEKIMDFKQSQRQEQIKYINGEKISEEAKNEMQQKYSLIIQSPLAVEFFQAEIKLDVLLADMQKIIGEGIKEIIEF